MTDTSTDVAQQQSRLPVALTGNLALDEAYRLSQALAIASVVPQAVRGKPSDVLAIILYGQEIGLRPMQSLQAIYVVEGRPLLSAQLWLALVRRAGHQAKIVGKHTAESCTVWMKRGDDGTEHEDTFTIADAVQGGKVTIKDGKPYARSQQGKPLPWELHTKQMLLARCVSNVARFICPEVALGFGIEGDEDEPDEIVTAAIVRPLGAPDEPVDPEIVEAELDDIEGQFTIEVPS